MVDFWVESEAWFIITGIAVTEEVLILCWFLFAYLTTLYNPRLLDKFVDEFSCKFLLEATTLGIRHITKRNNDE